MTKTILCLQCYFYDLCKIILLKLVKNKKVLDDINTLALTQTKLTKDQRKIQTTLPAAIDTMKAEKERLVVERDQVIKSKEKELTVGSKGEKEKNDKTEKTE